MEFRACVCGVRKGLVVLLSLIVTHGMRCLVWLCKSARVREALKHQSLSHLNHWFKVDGSNGTCGTRPLQYAHRL